MLYSLYHKKGDTSRFLVGVIIRWEKSGDILIELIDKDGSHDGFLLFCISDIYRIEVNCIYLRRLDVQRNGSFNFKKTDNWNAILNYAKIGKDAVKIQDHNGRTLAIGLVINYTNSSVYMQAIQSNGKLGRICCLQRVSIGFLFCGSRSEISRMNRYLGGGSYKYN